MPSEKAIIICGDGAWVRLCLARILVVGALLVAAACSRGADSDPATLYAAASDAVRQGTFRDAEDLIARGSVAAGTDAARSTAFRLLKAEILLMQRDVPGASALIDAAVPASPDAERLEARRRYLMGYRQIMAGQLAEALATLDDARTRANGAGATDVALDADVLAGQGLFRLGQWNHAEARLTEARKVAQRAGDSPREAGALVTLGMGQFVRDRFDEALGYFEPALALKGIDADLRYVTALSNAGASYARLGEFDRALELQRRAVALHESRNVPTYLEQALGELGHTEFLRGDPEAALALLSRARGVAAAAGRTANAALWLDSSATVLIDLSRWQEAERLNEESVRLKQQTPSSSTAPNLINRAQIAAGQRDHTRAIVMFEAALSDTAAPPWIRWQGHAGLAVALKDTGHVDQALEHFERALAVVETERASLIRPEYRMSFMARMMSFHRAYVDALVTSGQTLRALEVADASRARVLAERSGVAPAARTRAAAFVARARASRSVMLFYWLAPARSFVWTVTPGGVHLTELPSSTRIDELAGGHRAFIEQSLGDPRRTPNAPGDELSAAVLTPVLSRVPLHAHVIVVPDGSLHGVNFETLPVGPERRYWIEDATISVAPALSLLGARPRVPRNAGRSLLLIGDPTEGGGALARLKFAGAEMDGIRAAFQDTNVTIRRGIEASPASFLDGQPDAFSIVHFAAHATTSPLSPLDSAIELSPAADGRFKLYARDIAQRALRADLVTVSACRSAGDRAYGGEGLVGLAWAFLRAGATRVIAGLWDVDDQSTATLMTATYAGLAAGQPPADALRAAKLSLLAQGGNFAKPYYWAPFQVFTAGQ